MNLMILEQQRLLLQKKPLDNSVIQKLIKILKVSDEISLEVLRESLHLDRAIFLDKIYDWAEEFHFRIKGEMLIINQDTVDNFIVKLEKCYQEWDKNKQKMI